MFHNIFKNTKKNQSVSHNTKGWTAKPEEKETRNTEKIHTYNLLIVDASGSMYSIYKPALDGMNETLQTIRQAAEKFPEQTQSVTLVTFDTGNYNKIYDAKPALETKDITTSQYRPGGGTPLYDAMGRAITELRKKVSEKDAVLVTVITDGEENASCEYSGNAIRHMVEELSERGWLFTYIGANQDSASVSADMGIRNSLDFDASEEGTTAMFVREQDARMRWYGSRNRNPECTPTEGFFDEI